MLRYFALCFALIASALRAETPAHIEILPGWRDGARHIAALRIVLQPGWKTYWRSPGEAGIPPSFDLRDSQGLEQMTLHWPVPHVFVSSGMKVIGYQDELILPMQFDASSGVAHLRGRIDLGVCKDICMPLSAQLDAVLPNQGVRDPKIVAALQSRPQQMGAMTCLAEPNALSVEIDAPVSAGAGVSIEMPGAILGQAMAIGDGRRTKVSSQLYVPTAISRSDLRLTVIDPDGSAREYLGCK